MESEAAQELSVDGSKVRAWRADTGRQARTGVPSGRAYALGRAHASVFYGKALPLLYSPLRTVAGSEEAGRECLLSEQGSVCIPRERKKERKERHQAASRFQGEREVFIFCCINLHIDES